MNPDDLEEWALTDNRPLLNNALRVRVRLSTMLFLRTESGRTGRPVTQSVREVLEKWEAQRSPDP
jgi:hypothetical protein